MLAVNAMNVANGYNVSMMLQQSFLFVHHRRTILFYGRMKLRIALKNRLHFSKTSGIIGTYNQLIISGFKLIIIIDG